MVDEVVDRVVHKVVD